ncbi:hypothetical protein C5F59_017870 [Streptomyces sp. QL37]|uniref:hypothetical protein n=1 Tax=Streptomyces sp. QL37 TaxID=2093747 RepID=UPI000CF2F34A|nr:hypothetical protein [Streptomyces sp. QL37]PPQ58808.1 hypothetical protein C5F59_20720 [Streptomyces sp. QL37]
MNDMDRPESAEAPETTGSAHEPTGAPDPAARPGRARRILLTALPLVLVLAAVGGAATYTKITVDGADRSVETTVWKVSDRKPGKDPARDTSRGRADTALSKLMLPVPKGYRLGPDDGENGNDDEVDGERAVAAMKESNRGLAGKERREYDKRIDKLRVQGIVFRSYITQEDDLEVHAAIVRMKNKKSVRDFHTFQTGLFDALGIFREGPKVKGHTRNAACYLQPKDSDSDIEDMVCAAYDGELSISYSASGIKPVDKAAVAELLKDQLDHITSPGEYI